MPLRSLPRRTAGATAVAACAALLAAGLAPAADARSARHPDKATHVKIAAATSTSITVTTSRAAYAQKYTLFASTTKSDLYYDNLVHRRHTKYRHDATASGPRITVRGLGYTTKPYWYRVRTMNGSKYAYSNDILAGGVRPNTATSLRAGTAHGAISLAWSAGSVTGVTIKQATNEAMTTGVRYWRLSGNTHQFTPYGIKAGTRYWFAVKTNNNGTYGGWSNHVVGAASGREQNVKFMTYNLLSNALDGRKLAGNTISPWSRRGPAAAALIKQISPDVLTAQEAGNWVKGREYKTRQIDSLRSHLGTSGWGLAHTERTFAERRPNDDYCKYLDGYCRAYSYIIYKKSTMTPVGNGGHFNLDASGTKDQHWAAWQQFRTTSGATFLMVSAHLVQGRGYSLGVRREHETNALTVKAQEIADRLDVPIVYGGDFNTNPNPALYNPDGPGHVMRVKHGNDARLVAQKHYNAYTSVNNTLSRTPGGNPLHSIDYLFATPGVSVYSWGVGVRMKGGKLYGTIPSDHHAVYGILVLRS